MIHGDKMKTIPRSARLRKITCKAQSNPFINSGFQSIF